MTRVQEIKDDFITPSANNNNAVCIQERRQTLSEA